MDVGFDDIMFRRWLMVRGMKAQNYVHDLSTACCAVQVSGCEEIRTETGMVFVDAAQAFHLPHALAF